MSDTLDQSGIASFSGFDAETARRLRANLALIARQTDSEDLRGLVRRVLSGTEHVRAVFRHPAFVAMAAPKLENLLEGIRRLDPEERAKVFQAAGQRVPTEAELGGPSTSQ